MINLSYKPGYRTLKTTIAVFLCMLVSLFLNRPASFFSVAAAVVCIQPTHYTTKRVGLCRIIGTVIAGIISFFFLELAMRLPGYIDWLYLFAVPATIFAYICLCNIIDIKEAIVPGIMAFAMIVLTHAITVENTFMYVFDRTLDTIIGVVVAYFVNRRFFPEIEDIQTSVIKKTSPKTGENEDKTL